jgi:hypothetical protein
MVVLLGIDVHKATHTAVAVNEVGQKLGQTTVTATGTGHRELLEWARHRWPDERLRFAVEDCQQVSTRLERALLGALAHRHRRRRCPPRAYHSDHVRAVGSERSRRVQAERRYALAPSGLPAQDPEGGSAEGMDGQVGRTPSRIGLAACSTAPTDAAIAPSLDDKLPWSVSPPMVVCSPFSACFRSSTCGAN